MDSRVTTTDGFPFPRAAHEGVCRNGMGTIESVPSAPSKKAHSRSRSELCSETHARDAEVLRLFMKVVNTGEAARTERYSIAVDRGSPSVTLRWVEIASLRSSLMSPSESSVSGGWS